MMKLAGCHMSCAQSVDRFGREMKRYQQSKYTLLKNPRNSLKTADCGLKLHLFSSEDSSQCVTCWQQSGVLPYRKKLRLLLIIREQMQGEEQLAKSPIQLVFLQPRLSIPEFNLVLQSTASSI